MISFNNQENTLFVGQKNNTAIELIATNEPVTSVTALSDQEVILGAGVNKARKPVRLVRYVVEDKEFQIATSRRDLSAEQVAEAYRLRWEVETFFRWWKKHLSGYHLIARSEYGLKVQIFAGLITYLLLAIYCHKQFKETVSIYRLRELRHTIANELRISANQERRKAKEIRSNSKKRKRKRVKRGRART